MLSGLGWPPWNQMPEADKSQNTGIVNSGQIFCSLLFYIKPFLKGGIVGIFYEVLGPSRTGSFRYVAGLSHDSISHISAYSITYSSHINFALFVPPSITPTTPTASFPSSLPISA